jgi:hypothetical protein
MSYITLEQYNDQLKTLDSEIVSLRGQLTKKESLRDAAILLRDAAYPNAADKIGGASESEPKRKRHRLADYFPHVKNFLQQSSDHSASFHDIAEGLRVTMSDENIQDGHVYKILRKLEEGSMGIQRDPRKSGNFVLIV